MSTQSDESFRRVLIASANPLFASGLRRMVTQRWRDRQVEIRMAASMEEANAELESWQPHLVIVDYDDVDRPGNIQRGAFLSHFITGERSMQVMLVSLSESGEVVVYDRRSLTPAEAEDWLDLPWLPVAGPAPAAAPVTGAPPVMAEANEESALPAEPAAPPTAGGSGVVSVPELSSHPRSGGMKHYLIVGVLTILFTLILGFGLQAADLTPAPSSVQAGPIDAMIHLQTWLIAFIFSLITVFIVYSMVVFRQKNGSAEFGAPFKSSSRLEVAWTIVPLGLVLFLAFIGAQDLALVRQEDPTAMRVNVTAFQWGWQYEYPDYGIQTNTLNLPVNRQVRLVMTSRDVIHSFWVPEFRIKQDILPGKNLVKEVRITPNKPGAYKVRCAEMCGGAHALMEGPVNVLAQTDFDAWVDEQTNAADMPPEQRGQRLATTQGCLTCHSIDGSRIVGPTWKGMYGSDIPLGDGSTVKADDAYVHTAIVDPNAQVHAGYPPNVMVSYKDTLSEEQIADIIAFIKTIQ